MHESLATWVNSLHLTLYSVLNSYRYLRIVNPEGTQVVSGTRQITGRGQLGEVKQVMREALEDLGLEVPSYL